MPPIYDQSEAKRFIDQEHPEYMEYAPTLRLILDTLIGGPQYRDATYGTDEWGNEVRNLNRLKREMRPADVVPTDEWGNPAPYLMPKVDALQYNDAIRQDYILRLANTPVPNFLSTITQKQLAKIFKKQPQVTFPEILKEWVNNIDRQQTTLDEYMQFVIGPLLCNLGMLDLMFLHPVIPEGEIDIFYRDQDVNKSCVISYILWDRIPWWRLDYTGSRYLEINVVETFVDEKGKPFEAVRHWTVDDWTLYKRDGKVIGTGEHKFGIVPIVRVFDQKMLTRTHSPASRMMGVVDLTQRFYNEESWTVANLATHNCPVLVGPAEQPSDEANDALPVGRGFMLRKVLDRNGQHVGYEYLSPDTQTYEFMRLRLFDLIERIERQVALTRTIGSVGSKEASGPVAQSGVSKAYDQEEGSDWLASIAKSLQASHYVAMYMALVVKNDGIQNVATELFGQINVVYARNYNLLTFDDVKAIIELITKYQTGGIGFIPTLEKQTLRQLTIRLHPDLDQETLDEIHEQIDTLVDEAVKSRKEAKSRPQINQAAIPGQPATNPIQSDEQTAAA